MISVIKIGGNVIDDESALLQFVRDFAALPQPKVLVHGGGKLATRLSQRLGIETQMVDGRRITDAATIDVVTMVYAGLVNKRMVALLQAEGCNAMGLCGADANVVLATRRPARPIDYGFVGDIAPADVNADLLLTLVARGITPVLCSINHDGHGQLLNCNADSQASAIAKALASHGEPTALTYCFEKEGVLADAADDTSVIANITPDTYRQLRERQVITGGMIPKIDNAFEAIAAGVASVTIKSAANLTNDRGTIITGK